MPDWTYHPFFKPLLFRLPPNTGRRFTLELLAIQSRTRIGRRVFRLFGHGPPPKELAVEAFGLTFPAPVGLAPGIDTDGVAISVMQHLGFGFLCVGPAGADPRAQAADTAPLRVAERRAIVDSDAGAAPSAATLAARVAAAPELTIPIGLALTGPGLERALAEADSAISYFTIPPPDEAKDEGEDDGAADRTSLARLRAATKRPLLLRLSADWDDARVDREVAAAKTAGLDGCVAVDGQRCALLKEGRIDSPDVARRSLEIIRRVVAAEGERFPVIASGGLFTPADALLRLDAGAKLVELKAGLVYAGPGLPGRIVHALEHRLHAARPRLPLTPRPVTASFSWQLIALTGLALVASGLFALLLAATVKLLPPDTRYLGVSVAWLCERNGCRIVHFMAHDRVSFGGSIISIGLLYLWLATVPIRAGEPWAWWTVALSGALGFASFLTYRGYGYLDPWHAAATLLLIPIFCAGMWRARPSAFSLGRSIRVGATAWLWSPAGLGRALLTFSATGMILGGTIIMCVGMTRVFVPQDLEFMGVTVADLQALNHRLVPLIAHDRAGFGGGLASGGITVLLTLWCGARPGANGLWWALFFSGMVGFATAIGIHPIVGYTSVVHLLPAYLGAFTFVCGISLLRRPLCAAVVAGDGQSFSDF